MIEGLPHVSVQDSGEEMFYFQSIFILSPLIAPYDHEEEFIPFHYTVIPYPNLSISHRG